MGLLDRDYFVEDSLRRQGILEPGETLSRPRPPSDRPIRPPNVRGEKLRVPAGWTKPARNRDRWQTQPSASNDKRRTLVGVLVGIALAWVLIGLSVYAVITYAPGLAHRLDGSGRSPGRAKPAAPSSSTPAERFRPAATI